jgi:hypothetical protein
VALDRDALLRAVPDEGGAEDPLLRARRFDAPEQRGEAGERRARGAARAALERAVERAPGPLAAADRVAHPARERGRVGAGCMPDVEHLDGVTLLDERARGGDARRTGAHHGHPHRRYLAPKYSRIARTFASASRSE